MLEAVGISHKALDLVNCRIGMGFQYAGDKKRTLVMFFFLSSVARILFRPSPLRMKFDLLGQFKINYFQMIVKEWFPLNSWFSLKSGVVTTCYRSVRPRLKTCLCFKKGVGIKKLNTFTIMSASFIHNITKYSLLDLFY